MKKCDILMTNGTCVHPDGEFSAQVAIKDGVILEVGQNLDYQADEVFDASGLHVLPGVIDSQVHFREPGLTHKEDLETGSRAAAAGGVTCFLEMPNTNPPTTDAAAIAKKVQLARQKSYTDFGFFMGASADNLEELKKAHTLEGVCGIKIFLGSSTGTLLLYDEDKLLEIFKQCPGTIALHSEDEELLKKRIGIRDAATSAHEHPVWRNVETALKSTKKVVEIARKAGRKVHILHISTQEEIEFLAQNKDVCTVEVTPQHLSLWAPDCYDQLGTYAQMNPPIREKRHADALWKAVRDGVVDVIGSDHAPHTKEEKDQGYPRSPSGLPGVQTLLPLMLDHCHWKRLSLPRLVELVCTGPAKLYNLKNRGLIKEGYRADLTLVDLKLKHKITHDQMQSRCGWTPFHGREVQGYPTHTFIAGQCVWKLQGPELNKAQIGPI